MAIEEHRQLLLCRKPSMEAVLELEGNLEIRAAAEQARLMGENFYIIELSVTRSTGVEMPNSNVTEPDQTVTSAAGKPKFDDNSKGRTTKRRHKRYGQQRRIAEDKKYTH